MMLRILGLTFIMMLFSSNVFTCWYDDGNYGYAFFKKELISDPKVLYFVNYSARLGIGYTPNAERPEQTNILSWQGYLGAEANEVDVKDMVYKTPIATLENLLDNRKLLKKEAKSNEVLAIWAKNKKLAKSMGNYLIFAKKCAKEATKLDVAWDQSQKRDQKQMQELLKEGELAYQKERDDFIKERYAFQLLRLQFYMEDYDGMLAAFKNYFPEEPESPSYIYFRALELKAGVLFRQGQPEASYLYAKVFANCPDRQEVCLNSFSICSEQDWNRSIRMCKTDEERVVFHAMRGLQPTANPVEEIANILEIQPSSPYAELLFCRYISEAQQEIFPAYYEEYQRYPKQALDHSPSLEALYDICAQLLEKEDKLPNQDFWKVARAYLELINGSSAEAMKWCTKVDQASVYFEQAKIIRFVAQLCALNRLDNNTADAIWQAYQNDPVLKKNQNISQFLTDVFAMLYYKQGDFAKAFLTHNNLESVNMRLDLQLLEDMEAFIQETKSPGVYEKFLLEKRCLGAFSLDRVKMLRGVYYLQHNQLDKAIAAFKDLSAAYQQKDPYFNNPYLDKSIWTESIGQPLFYLDVNVQPVRKLYEEYAELNQSYNLLTFTQKLKDLQQKAQAGGEKAAEYYYLLGTAWHSISPAGWSRPAIYLARGNSGHSNWYSTGTQEEQLKHYRHYSWSSYRYFDAGIGTSYFEKAMEVASDPELKARACYMAAKMQKAKLHTEFWWESDKVNLKKYHQLVDQFKAEYANTQYYQEVIKECPIFRAKG